MTISLTLRNWIGFAFAPGNLYQKWQKRFALRRDLARLCEDPYLLDDVGFSRELANREIDRPVWEPVCNLRVSATR